jgi:hypothetical protein
MEDDLKITKMEDDLGRRKKLKTTSKKMEDNLKKRTEYDLKINKKQPKK